ncbi:MAG: hypothetical protein NT051_02050 [Candidatus Micrarchaeota archaeon]|nr:hypothetical protein [Candidatus Micrarchaeota archaeon]
MQNCVRCGAQLGEYESGATVCQTCESHASAVGSGSDVPCQRCGMYLPSHELQMWNSRLYCAYCIMDVRDEERYGKEKRKSESAPRPSSQEGRTKSGICQRCGRDASVLYTSQGILLCANCNFSDGAPGAGGGSPSRFGQIVSFVKKKLGIKPKIITTAPIPAAQACDPQVFDLHKRRMVDKKSALEAKKPMSEKNESDKKPPEAPAKVKKFLLPFKKRSDSK